MRGNKRTFPNFHFAFVISMNSNIFNTPCHLNKWKKSCHLLSRVLWWKEFEFIEIIKCKNESLGKSFYSLSFNFQKVSNFTHFQSINQTVNQIYLFIITFQNLEFWDVTGIAIRKITDLIREKEKRRTLARTNERANAHYLNRSVFPVYLIRERSLVRSF